MIYSLDLDDFSVLNNRLDLLLRLKESYPKLKVSLFTIPYDLVYEKDVSARLLRDKTLEKIKENLEWLEIIPHGLLHMPREFEKCTYETMKNYIFGAIDEAFKKDGLPYVKGFKAPYWLWNEGVVKALDEEGWWGAINRDTDMITPKKYFKYSHKINEPFSKTVGVDVIKLHGHITPHDNNIERCFFNLFKMDPKAEFKFASELLEYENSSLGK
jgi:hypothetical protein